MRRFRLPLLGLFAFVLVACAGTRSGSGADAHGRAFPGLAPDSKTTWTVAETNGTGSTARWEPRSFPAAGSGAALVETTNRGQTFNLLLSTGSFPADLEMTVLLRADGGVEDQGGGLLWRAQGPDDYYVTRWNPLEDNLRIYKVVGGVRQQLGHAKVRSDPRAWHRLDVRTSGSLSEVSLDGAKLLSVSDPTFTAPGPVGLWTKADAATSFAELKIHAIGR